MTKIGKAHKVWASLKAVQQYRERRNSESSLEQLQFNFNEWRKIMFNKKQIVVAITSAMLLVGTGAAFAALTAGGAGTAPAGTSATTGGTSTVAPSAQARQSAKANSAACKAARTKVDSDKKDDDDRKSVEGKSMSLTHHSSDHQDGRTKHNDDDGSKAKHKAHDDERLAACGEDGKDDGKDDERNDDRKDDDQKSHDNNGFGNGDQNAPGGSEMHNGAENRGGNN